MTDAHVGWREDETQDGYIQFREYDGDDDVTEALALPVGLYVFIREDLESRLEAYETAVREWDEWGGKQHKEEPADAGWCSACGADWPCPSARLRDLSSQESE